MWDRFLRLVPGVLRSESGLLDCSFSMELADQFPVMELADDPIILFRGGIIISMNETELNLNSEWILSCSQTYRLSFCGLEVNTLEALKFSVRGYTSLARVELRMG
jgi:hypothetical protein